MNILSKVNPILLEVILRLKILTIELQNLSFADTNGYIR